MNSREAGANVIKQKKKSLVSISTRSPLICMLKPLSYVFSCVLYTHNHLFLLTSPVSSPTTHFLFLYTSAR